MTQRITSTICTAIVGALLGVLPVLGQGPGEPPLQLSMEEAVRIALEQNLQIELSRSALQSAEARVSGAFGAFLPTVSVSGGYTKQLNEAQTVIVGGVPIQSSRPDNTLNSSASASLVVFDGFSRTSSYSVAQNAHNASIENLAHVRKQIEFQARQAYLQALRAQQVVDVRRSDLDVSRDRLERIRVLVEVGTAQIGQVYSQEAEVANRELEFEQSLTDAMVARNALALVLNLDPAGELQLSTQGLVSSVAQEEIDATRAGLGTFEEMLARQRETRRDLQELRLRIQAAVASVEASRGGYWPTISTSLSYAWTKSSGIDASDNTSLSVDLRYMPFDGFRTSEQVQIAEAQRLQVEVEYQSQLASARSRLKSVLARFDGADRQIRASQKAFAAARQNRYSADERYRLGAGTEADFILANSQYLSAQINQINALFNYQLVLYELQFELGN